VLAHSWLLPDIETFQMHPQWAGPIMESLGKNGVTYYLPQRDLGSDLWLYFAFVQAGFSYGPELWGDGLGAMFDWGAVNVTYSNPQADVTLPAVPVSSETFNRMLKAGCGAKGKSFDDSIGNSLRVLSESQLHIAGGFVDWVTQNQREVDSDSLIDFFGLSGSVGFLQSIFSMINRDITFPEIFSQVARGVSENPKNAMMVLSDTFHEIFFRLTNVRDRPKGVYSLLFSEESWDAVKDAFLQSQQDLGRDPFREIQDWLTLLDSIRDWSCFGSVLSLLRRVSGRCELIGGQPINGKSRAGRLFTPDFSREKGLS